MKQPSRDWKEIIRPDEEERYRRYTEIFRNIQKEKSAKYGNGRALHRKQLLAARAEFEVLPGLPEYASFGLFAKPGKYESHIRLSNGGMDVKSDSTPDIRGFAVKVLGVTGPSALGNGNTDCQDFLLINQEVFGVKSSVPFVELVQAAAKGPLSVFGYFMKEHGFFGAFSQMKQALGRIGKKFTGFATEPFFSAVPISCGPYAVRVRMLPAAKDINPDAKNNWGVELSQRLKNNMLTYEFQLQFYADEKSTPIEDASVNWEESEIPYVTVAKLHILKQDTDSSEGKKFSELAEKSVFDPWKALADHRPLGDVMRARKAVYYASQKERGAS